METFEIKGEFIELNKLLKAMAWVQTGGHAKMLVQSGVIFRNGEPETRVRAKLIDGDLIEWEKMSVKLSNSSAIKPELNSQ